MKKLIVIITLILSSSLHAGWEDYLPQAVANRFKRNDTQMVAPVASNKVIIASTLVVTAACASYALYRHYNKPCSLRCLYRNDLADESIFENPEIIEVFKELNKQKPAYLETQRQMKNQQNDTEITKHMKAKETQKRYLDFETRNGIKVPKQSIIFKGCLEDDGKKVLRISLVKTDKPQFTVKKSARGIKVHDVTGTIAFKERIIGREQNDGTFTWQVLTPNPEILVQPEVRQSNRLAQKTVRF